MKKRLGWIVAMAVCVLALGSANAFAKGKEVTLTGEAKCAKCMLHQGDKCQTVIETTAKNGKKLDYYVLDNSVSKAFHTDVCHAAMKVTATGTVKKDGKKKGLLLTKIEPVK